MDQRKYSVLAGMLERRIFSVLAVLSLSRPATVVGSSQDASHERNIKMRDTYRAVNALKSKISKVHGADWENEIEGNTLGYHEKYEKMSELADDPRVNTICEIGFNAGFSAANFLVANPTARLISFDIFSNAYVPGAVRGLHELFQGREVTIVAGPSDRSVPSFRSLLLQGNLSNSSADIGRKGNKSTASVGLCNLIFIDGGHNYDIARADVRNMLSLADPSFNRVLIDDIHLDGVREVWSDLLTHQDLEFLQERNSSTSASASTSSKHTSSVGCSKAKFVHLETIESSNFGCITWDDEQKRFLHDEATCRKHRGADTEPFPSSTDKLGIGYFDFADCADAEHELISSVSPALQQQQQQQQASDQAPAVSAEVIVPKSVECTTQGDGDCIKMTQTETVGEAEAEVETRRNILLEKIYILTGVLESRIAEVYGAGWTVRLKLEGNTKDFYEKFQKLSELAGDPRVKTICEIGFNSGYSTLNFLVSNPTAKVLSFDLFENKYVPGAVAVLQRMFPDRDITVVAGSSLYSVPNIRDMLVERNALCNLIFIDGGHTTEIAEADILNMAPFADPEYNRVIIDDIEDPQVAVIWNHMLLEEKGFAKVTIANRTQSVIFRGLELVHSKPGACIFWNEQRKAVYDDDSCIEKLRERGYEMMKMSNITGTLGVGYFEMRDALI
jgi:tRNA G46 methylase TrmB